MGYHYPANQSARFCPFCSSHDIHPAIGEDFDSPPPEYDEEDYEDENYEEEDDVYYDSPLLCETCGATFNIA